MKKPQYRDTAQRILTSTGIFSYCLNLFFLLCFDEYEFMPLVTMCLVAIILIHHTFYYYGLYKFTFRRRKAGYETHVSYATYRWLTWGLIILTALVGISIMELVEVIF